MSDRLIVAIDGPGGVGKSTTSREVAARLGIVHLDTGAFYRAATVAVLAAGVDAADAAAVSAVVAGVSIDQDRGRTTLNGLDVSEAIRGDDVTAAVSAVSAHPAVRKRMVEGQQRWVHAHGNRAVIEGRDIGTVVFPDATLKVYLDADPAIRAARRSGESGAAEKAVRDALAKRDHLDSSRSASPLIAAADAVTVDTTHLTIDEVVETIVALLKPA